MQNLGRDIRAEERLKTELVIVTGLLLLYVIFRKAFLLYSALALGLIFLFFPAPGNRIVAVWSRFVELCGWINSRVLLSIVYVVFLTPISFLAGLFGKTPLVLEDPGTSLYVMRNHTYTANDLEDIY